LVIRKAEFSESLIRWRSTSLHLRCVEVSLIGVDAPVLQGEELLQDGGVAAAAGADGGADGVDAEDGDVDGLGVSKIPLLTPSNKETPNRSLLALYID